MQDRNKILGIVAYIPDDFKKLVSDLFRTGSAVV